MPAKLFGPIGLLRLIVIAIGVTGCDGHKAPPAVAAKPVVGVVTIHAHAVAITAEFAGRTVPYRVAEVRPRVAGLVEKRLFDEGQNVTAGQQLYKIDPAPYQASLASAEAGLARAVAAVGSDRATVARYRPLADAQAISRQDLDVAVAALGEAEADVAAGRASVETAIIDLGYTNVTAPISGRTGRSSVTEGALVTASQAAALVTITQLDPIYVDVTQSSATVMAVEQALASGQMVSAGATQARVHLTLEDGQDYGQTGMLQFSEVMVDQGTDSVTVRAIFPNAKGLLLPGMFVRETIEEGVRRDGLLVPQRGVTRDPRGQAIAMVLGQDGKVAQRSLTTDRAIGNDWLVSTGIGDGDRVIVDGLQKIQPGEAAMAAEVAPEIAAPAAAANP